MSNPPNNDGTINTQSGAVMEAFYVRRSVKVLAIQEHEVDHIAFLNTQSTIFFSLSSALFFFAIGIWVNASFQETMTPAATLLSKVGAPASILLSLVCVAIAVWCLCRRKSQLDHIKEQSSEALSSE